MILIVKVQGYHPSAEELDAIYRQRTWTTNLIRNEQDRTQFKPRYSYQEKYKKDYKDNFYVHTVQPTKETVLKEPNIKDTNQKLPIFFTNPVTGIVYAISEIGKGSNVTTANPSSIPIYITKEQYDRDILNIKRKYSQQCSLKTSQKPKAPIVNLLTNLATTNKKIKVSTPDTQLEPPKKNTDKPVFNIPSTQSYKVTTRPISKPKPGIVIPITQIPPKKVVKKVKNKKLKNKKKRTRRSSPTEPSDFHFSKLNPTRDKNYSELVSSTIGIPKSKEIPPSSPLYDDDDYYNDKPDDYNDDYVNYEDYPKDDIDSYDSEVKRTQKQQAYDDYYEYEDYDYDAGVFSVFGMIFRPVQMIVTKFLSKAGGYISGDEAPLSTRKPKFPQYTEYNPENPSPTRSSWNSWFGGWGGGNKHQKMDKVPTTAPTPTKSSQSSWSWFGGDDSQDDYDDDYGSWFFGWFDSKKKAAPPKTTSNPPPAILTIADPLKNPNKWIGILAHHIVNSTTTTTGQPELEESETVKKVSYDKFQIWRLKPHSDSQVKALEDFMKTPEGLKILWLMGPSLR